MSDASDRQDEPVADLSGRQLGDYRLLRRLGRGAMAEVYLAEQGSLNRQVAVKVLKSQLASDRTYVQRFQREAQAAAALVHANIVQIHEVGCIDGVYFIAQEYVQGLNLRQWMTRNGALDLPTALIVMRQVAAALAKASEQGIVHRDIKPENIMITRSGEVKVADFGLARLPRVGDSVDLTQAGMTMGTPLYMSPEQVEGHPLDPRSDIYSFGVTCYSMLAGKPPFQGDTALSVAVQHLKKQPESLENLRRDLPPALCRIVHKMLAKSRENRHQSARELLKDLRQVQLEHLDQEWPEDLPGWETAGLDLATSLTETTQRLDALMKTAAQARRLRLWWILWAFGTIAALILGGALAWATIVDSPLLGPPPKVERREDIYRQFLYALQMGNENEEAWQAVVDYFPQGDPSWVNSAKKQLAWIHLLHGDDDKALEIFDDLASPNTADQQLRVFGLAGKYWVCTQKGDRQQAADAFAELWPILREAYSSRQPILDRRMAELFWRAYRESGEKSPGEISEEQFRQWLDQLDEDAAQPD